MNKKVLSITVVVIVIVAIGIGIFWSVNKANNSSNNIKNNNEGVTLESDNTENDENKNIVTKSNDNILVTYFSATGTTKQIAEYIADETKGELVEIVAKEKYTSNDLNYNSDCRANKEQQDDSARPEIANKIDFDNYDTIFIGYPVWWGDVPKIILTLLDTYNLDGKTVIPFCTSGGSGITQSENTLKSYNTNINWLQGKRFSSSGGKTEVSTWIKDLNIK